MALTPWKKLAVEVLHENPYWKYCKARFIGPKGKEHDYFFCDCLGGACVIGITAEGTIPWVKQYRPLFARESIELPMGGRGGQDPLPAAIREFAEEAKMHADHIEHVGQHASCNGIVNETMDIFVAWGLQAIESEQDELEEFEHLLLTPDDVDRMIHAGEITDGQSVAAWCQAKPRVLEVIDQLKAKR
ncbi:NUDIX hydrolase [Candidatus Uhrbacteria bacterium]|nr:NUDIX hydrolase [Candidatus Uhrbacteria bacterium]